MSEQPPTARPDEPTLDDVIEPEHQIPRDRQEHGKSPDRPSDDMLEAQVAHEREQVEDDRQD